MFTLRKKMKKKKNNINGFSLVEVIIVLLLVGMLVVGAGTFIVYIVSGYSKVQTNADTAQKVDLAVSRLRKEIRWATNGWSTTVNSILLTSCHPDKLGTTYTIALSGSNLELTTTPPGDTDILMDKVDTFTASDTTNSISFSLTPQDAAGFTYSITMCPRFF